LLQSELVAERLRRGGLSVEVVRIVTEGDQRPEGTSPGEGMFVSALEQAVLEGRADLAVHSAKDMPLGERPGLLIAAYPERADPRDALVTPGGGATIETLPEGATIGTDSPRRAGFAACCRPDLVAVPLHGNVDTRLRKLDEGQVNALVLAAAGLDRLGRGDRIDCRLSPDVMPPAPAQGALAVQVRSADRDLVEALAQMDDWAVRMAVEAERQVLVEVGGGCRSPVGALAELGGGRLRLLAAAVGRGGRRLVRDEDDPTEAGKVRLAASAGSVLRAHLAARVPR
jgi:hydroxymethylbilane synthase